MASPKQSGHRAPVLEVFASIQGEGRYVGEPQTFVRLRGCPLRCTYCDTPHSWRVRASDRAALDSRPAREEPTWATPFQVACWVAEVERGAPRAVSLTGGEPLAWTPFLRELSGMLGERKLRLETAGVPVDGLEDLREVVDHVSLDLKLAGDLRAPVPIALPEPDDDEPRIAPEQGFLPTDEGSWRRARRDALRLLRGRDACAKLVLTAATDAEQALVALEDLAELAPELPIFIQPATPVPGIEAPGSEALDALVEQALDLDLTVRLVPQVHALTGRR